MYFSGTKCCAIVFCSFLSFSALAKDAGKPSQIRGLSKPFCFVENIGQVTDKSNHARTDIHYKLSAPGINLFLGNGKLNYQFRNVKGTPESGATATEHVMEVALIGANPNAAWVPSAENAYIENYYALSNNKQCITAHAYNKVTYRNVYPNIDWVVYTNNGKVEYDFVVRPGGKVSDIKLKYTGANDLAITGNGSLLSKTPLGQVEEQAPYSYETTTGKEVASRYVVNGDIVSFNTGAYKGTLTIDPYLLWSTYFGGTAEDVVTSVKVANGGGTTFAGGYTVSTGLGTAGVHQQNKDAVVNYDAFIARYDNTGTMQWCSYVGAAGIDLGTSVAVDVAGTNVYLAGYTTSAPAPGALASGAGVYQTANGGGNDGFLLKFNATVGNRVWGTFYGGTGEDFIRGIAVDIANNVLITGQTSSGTSISTGTHQLVRSGTIDAFIAKINGINGNRIWGTYYGGSAQETANCVATDGANNVIIVGRTNSVVNIAYGTAHQPLLDGTNDAFVAKFNTGGVVLWGTYFGSTDQEEATGVACNPATNDIAIIGNTTSTTGMSTPKAHQTSYGGGLQDVFVSHFAPSGSLYWSSYYGGTDVEYGEGVCFDQFNNVAVAGGTFSNTNIASPLSFQNSIGGDYDAFVAKFNTIGQRLWGSYFGNTAYDYANSIACDLPNDQIVLGGYTTSTTGIATPGADQTVYSGGLYDGFVTKFRRDTIVTLRQPYTDTLVCAGGILEVPYNTFSPTTPFNPSNVFSVELSDVSGSFVSPVIIGTVSATTSGTVTCTVPVGTSIGSGYRLRITSSSPAYISPDNYMDITVVAGLPSATASATTPVCVGGNILLDVTATYSVATYSWAGPAGSGFSSAIRNPTNTSVTLLDAGTYFITTTHNGCPPSTAAINVNVNSIIPPTPIPSVTVPVCFGSTMRLFADPDTTATGITYHWSGPGGFTSTLQNPTPTASVSGYYFLTDTFDACPSAITSIFVDVLPLVPVGINITVTPNDTICAGTTVNFASTIVGGGSSPTFQWMTNSFTPVVGAVSSTFTSSTLRDADSVFCIMNSNITCPSLANAPSNKIRMSVISSPPLAYITASPGTSVVAGSTVTFTSVIFNGGTSPAYQWVRNGVGIAGENNSTYIRTNITAYDTISVIVTSNMPCATPAFAESNKLIVHPNTGITNANGPLDQLQLFPNPNTGKFTLQGNLGSLATGTISYEVMNTLGQLVYSSYGNNYGQTLEETIEVPNAANGTYLIRVMAGGEQKVFRFTIAR